MQRAESDSEAFESPNQLKPYKQRPHTGGCRRSLRQLGT